MAERIPSERAASALSDPAVSGPRAQRRAGIGADLLCIPAGGVLPLAFAPFGHAPLAWLSLLLLLHLWGPFSARRGAWRGWLYGLGVFGVGVSWIQVSVHQFGLPVLAFSVSATLLFVMILALYPALCGYLLNRFFPDPDRLRVLLAFPALWTLSEWLRSWLFTGFPWLNLGYSQIDTPLSGWAPIAGVYGLSLAVAGSAGLLYWCFSQRRTAPLAVLALVWGLGWGCAQITWTEADGEALKIGLVQGNIAQSLKWVPGQRAATIKTYFDLSAPHWGEDLIVWPETAIPEFYSERTDYIAALQQQALASNTDLLIGVPLQREGQSFNAVATLGKVRGFYRKRHLVPFGEFIPFEPWLPQLLRFLDIPMSSFTPGPRRQPLLRLAGRPVGVSICYEDAFGEEVIDTLPEAALLINVSNDAWFGDSIAPHQHLEMARMRALETGRYLLRATNTGVSAVIGPQGEIVARAPQFEATALGAEVRGMRGATPYVRLGNYPTLALACALLLAAWGLRRSRHARPLPQS